MKAFVVTFFVMVGTFSVPALAEIDAYRVLGVQPNATQDQLTKAWRILATRYMPLANIGDSEATKKMQEINAAWNLVKTAEKRANYNATFSSGSQRRTNQTSFKDTNVDEVIAKHPEWATILSDYDRGVEELITKGDWVTLLKIYEAVVDDDFSSAVFRGLSTLEDSPRLRQLLSEMLDIEVKYSPDGRLWNLSVMCTNIFSREKFAKLTVELLPKFFRHADRFDLRCLLRDFFAKSHSLHLGDRYLWEIVRKTRAEEDKGTLWKMADGVFRGGETGPYRDPELVVAMVKEDDSVMAERILAWCYIPAWGGRGVQAIIDRVDPDAMNGLRKRLATSDFADKQWDIYREALKLPDEAVGPKLQKSFGKLELREPEPMFRDCESLLTPASAILFESPLKRLK